MYKNKKTRPAARTVGCLFALGALGLGSAAHAAEAFSPNSKWMLGDWGGKRTELLEKGYDFKLEYVGEAAANLDGGYDDDKTGRYTDQFALGVHMDLEKILGWKAAEFQFTVTERNGKNLSNDRIGDPRAGHISSSAGVWGRGQTWRLDPAVAQAAVLRRRAGREIRRFGEGEDFNSFPCDFQNLAFCGSQVGKLGRGASGTTGRSASGRCG
ncbi:carbohydrate porin [Pseudomonas aeruginosa]|uniref:carbohydrate porin n=1 Tax=Pseudomonas aeruginosa TaxID=287 RepID=UPI002238A67C|nr:carbohydrate porin [Pseudomonas aeruginosa]